ncbi:tetratricopeptide repeat protein [Sphaerimonospora sp. CA-214678]|uniref:tetratricopeptide repeat protein n=1 Tax=Sphaerimonospora sp. CA-214678 TaxID=3240029 RepID=UPI003D8F7C70
MASRWRLASAPAVAAAAALVAAWADNKPLGTVIWAAVGGVGGAFAPTLWEHWKQIAENRQRAKDTAEPLLDADPGSVAYLLHPSREVVPFRGREQKLDELLAWCEEPGAGRLRLLVGPGGVGKSRLAVELGHRLDPSWGFVEVRDDAEEDALSKWRAADSGKVLMVVDYAETRAGLVRLLQEVAADEGRRVRVLLLARSAGEWWQRLGGESRGVRKMIADAGQGIQLTEEDPALDPEHDEVKRAIPYFAAKIGTEPPQRVSVDFGDERPRILDLHAAALVAVLRSAHTRGSEVRLKVSDVLDELLGHERRYWQQSANVWGIFGGGHGLSPRVIEQVVAVGTLLGARDHAQAVEVVKRVPGRPAVVDPGRVADWLRELYPPLDDHEWLGRLRPDRLAELHVTRELAAAPELLDACMERGEEQQRRQALVTLARAAQELDAAGDLLQHLLPVVVGEVGSIPASRDTLEALYAALPYPSDTWAEANAALAQRLLDSIPPDADVGERASRLSTLGIHLSELGRPADALPVTEEAVAIYRELAVIYPDRYRPDLAGALNNLGGRFSELGRPAHALPVTEEAVAIHRELAQTYPDRYRPDLAGSLHNLGTTLSELGRPAHALPVTEEAVAIYRELADIYPDRYRPDLAGALNNLGTTLSELGRPAHALPVTEEAVAIYRELADIYPDRYRPDLARSLSNLGNRFRELGRPADALPVTEEAVAIYRELADIYPDRYRPDLARSLSNLGIYLSELGRPADALPVTEEAVAIYRELAQTYPDRYRPDLAHSLASLGIYLSELGRPADALPVTEEAVAIYRELADIYPDRYRPDLAPSLHNLGIYLSELGRPADALLVEEEAVAIYRELADIYPDRYRPYLAHSLASLGRTLSELGRPADALPVTEEAVAIHRELAVTYPDRYRPGLAGSLHNLGRTLSELGRPADALPVTEEAVAIHRELAQTYPDRYRPDLAHSLASLGNRFWELGRLADALPVTEEAVAIHRELAQTYPDRYRPYLAHSLASLGIYLSELGRPADALPLTEEAVTIYRELARRSPEQFQDAYAITAALVALLDH